MATFGEKIRMRREELRLTQEQLAALAGLTRRSIVSYETTGKRPYASTVQKIAAALGGRIFARRLPESGEMEFSVFIDTL